MFSGLCRLILYIRSGLSDTQLHTISTTLANGSLKTDEVSSGSPTEVSDDDSDEEFVYPGIDTQAQVPAPEAHDTVPPPVAPVQHHPSPAQLESLYAAASSGDLSLLQQLFRNALQTGEVEDFALANDASSRTGQTALHAAARKGYLDIVKWCKLLHLRRCHLSYMPLLVVEDCGAIANLEDKEGEVCEADLQHVLYLLTMNARLLYTRQLFMDTFPLLCIYFLTRQTFMLEMLMVGRRCITPVQK